MPVEISTDDIKNVLAGEKEKKIQVIHDQRRKGHSFSGTSFPERMHIQNGITLEYMYFKMDPKRSAKRIIQSFNCQQDTHPWSATNVGNPYEPLSQ